MPETRVEAIAASAAAAFGIPSPSVVVHAQARPPIFCSLRRYEILISEAWLTSTSDERLKWAVWHEVKTLAVREDIWAHQTRIESLRTECGLSVERMRTLLDIAIDLYLEGPFDYAHAGRRFLKNAAPATSASQSTVLSGSGTQSLDLNLALISQLGLPRPDEGPHRELVNQFHWVAFLEILVRYVQRMATS